MLPDCISRLLYKPALAGMLLFGMMASPIVASAQVVYQVQSHWKIGGEGGWDYMKVDPVTHHLYVTHGPRVEVLDLRDGKVIGSITGLQGTHGVALDKEGKYGYISDGRGNAVVVFDRHSLQRVATIPVTGVNPDGIVYEPVTKTVWAFNGHSKSVSVIDTVQRKVVATIALPGKPEFPVADGKGMVFDNIESTSQMVKLDAVSRKLVATWSLTGCESPSGLAFDAAHRHLFSVCDNQKMAVTDADTGKVLANPTIGDSPDAARFDAKHQLAFSSNGEGTLTVVDARNYKVLQDLKTERGARTMALDEATGRIFVVTAQFGPRPAATAVNPRPRPAIVPDSFTVLVLGRK
ncbi:MAG: YncE family protein [Acidobacteriaceae bacterium]